MTKAMTKAVLLHYGSLDLFAFVDRDRRPQERIDLDRLQGGQSRSWTKSKWESVQFGDAVALNNAMVFTILQLYDSSRSSTRTSPNFPPSPSGHYCILIVTHPSILC